MKIRQILCLLYQHNKITKKAIQQFNQIIVIMEENMIWIRDLKIYYFDFDWSKDVKLEFIIKRN